MDRTESKPDELPEKDFIRENLRKNPAPAWIWLAIVITISLFLWTMGSLYRYDIGSLTRHSPFLQVTNRQMSLFLWQYSSLMRTHVKHKAAYLPGFQFLNKLNVEDGFAEEYVQAPPEVLFLYHTWDRLIATKYFERPIDASEFREFLDYCVEWQSVNWPGSSKEYSDLVSTLPSLKDQNLQQLSDKVLPKVVRQAFQGWKNYMKEGELINGTLPTYRQIGLFLKQNPYYARNYWQNIFIDTVPNYLKSVFEDPESDEIVPADELAPFLKVAFYNFIHEDGNL